MLGPPGGGELAFDGGFEDGGAVALQVRLRPLQRRHAGIQVGEEFLDLRDDPPLLVRGGNRNGQSTQRLRLSRRRFVVLLSGSRKPLLAKVASEVRDETSTNSRTISVSHSNDVILVNTVMLVAVCHGPILGPTRHRSRLP